MTYPPETQYAHSVDGTNIAYQVTGDGPLDVLFIPALTIPVDLMWEDPSLVRIRNRLGAFSRTVWFEPRGWGASEGAPLGFNEERRADLGAVLDAVGSERAALVGVAHGGPGAIRFADAHSERVSHLVLLNTFAHYVREPDYPWGFPAAVLQRAADQNLERRGTGADVETLAPSRFGDERFRQWWARGERLAGGPAQLAGTMREGLESDVRPLLGLLRIPTLVLHRQGNRYIRVGAGRYLAEHIPGAKLVVLPGDDHLFFVGDSDGLVDEIEEFLTGTHQAL